MDKQAALEKLRKYCSYQDRCHAEVRRKLQSLGIHGEWKEEIITELISENYLNEERYARSIARGKFRIKKWGKNKIVAYLKKNNISDHCISIALEELDREEYIDTLRGLIYNEVEKRSPAIKNGLLLKDAVIKYAGRRGYEADEIFKLIRELEISSDNPFGK